jgi:uncharacterized membrane protein
MFLVGCIISASGLACFLSLSQYIPALKEKLIPVIAADLLGGTGAGIAFGLELGVPRSMLILVSIIFNITCLLTCYPLIMSYSEKLARTKVIERVFNSTRNVAKKRQQRIEKWGIPGVAFFVWLPIHSTGPLVGAIIGRLIGMRMATVILTVMLATTAGAVCWAYTFDRLFEVAEKAGTLVPSIFVILIIVIAVLSYLGLLPRKRNRKG